MITGFNITIVVVYRFTVATTVSDRAQLSMMQAAISYFALVSS